MIVCANYSVPKWYFGEKDKLLVNLLNLYSVAANGFRVAKDYENAKIAYEKASKGQEMLSSYPYMRWYDMIWYDYIVYIFSIKGKKLSWCSIMLLDSLC